MKQIFIESSDAIQLITKGVEKHGGGITGLSEFVEQSSSKVIGLCSEKLCNIDCLNWPIDYLDVFCVILAILFLLSIWKPWFKIGLFHHLKIPASLVWLLGVAIYMVGFNEHGSAESWIALTLRSCLSSMEMFVSHSDLIEVRKELHGNATYMAIFSLTHFCAVVISAIFILRLFGFRAVSWIKVVWSYCKSLIPFGSSSCNYYIMFGINANTMALAKSITEKQRHRIIFINLPDKGHSHASTRFSFSHFFHSDSNGVDKYIEDIEKMGALLFNSSRSFDNVDLSFGKSDVFKVFRALEFSWIGRAALQKMLRKTAMRNGGKVEYFFLSENEYDNLIAVTTLQRLQKEPLDDENAFNCYCHARKNRDNSALLNGGTLAFKVHIIDTSNLAMLELKTNSEYHPVNFVDKGDAPGTVASAFTGMVIGFGETGRDAFRFLYEFSSFTKDDEGNPSVKKIHIVDKDIEGLKADFLNEAPVLRHKSEVDWWKVKSTHSEGFWERLKEVIQELNYVVITVRSDEEAVGIATSIFEYAYRYRNNLNKFKIFVRLRNSIQEDFLRTHREYFNVIIPFGSNKTAFSYEVINNDILEKKAKRFFYRYEKLVNGKPHSSGDAKKEEECAAKAWKDRRAGYLNESDIMVRKESEIKIWYQEEQDKSNAWHIYTKVALAKDDITSELLLLDSSKRLLNNLSDCEHLRWNAKMELLGFESAIDKDIQKVEVNCREGEKIKRPWKNFRLRKHECMVDCKTLHTNPILSSTIPYDKSTVELSFMIVEDEKNINDNLKIEKL